MYTYIHTYPYVTLPRGIIIILRGKQRDDHGGLLFSVNRIATPIECVYDVRRDVATVHALAVILPLCPFS